MKSMLRLIFDNVSCGGFYYIYHDCFIESKQVLQNVLCVAPANVVTP